MKKIFVFIFLFFLFISIPKKLIYADTCTINIIAPKPFSSQDRIVTMEVSSLNISPNKLYNIKYDNKNFVFEGPETNRAVVRSDTPSSPSIAPKILLNNLNYRGALNMNPNYFDLNFINANFGDKTHTIEIVEITSESTLSSCEFKTNANGPAATSSEKPCTFNFPSQEYSSRNPIKFAVKDLLCSRTLGLACLRRVLVKRYPNTEAINWCISDEDLQKEITLPALEPASYYLEIRNVCQAPIGLGEHELCSQNFDITRDGKGGGLRDNDHKPGASVELPKPPCGSEKDNQKCPTAIGSIDVSSPENFIKQLFTLILFVAGTGAVIIFIVAGYNLMTSAGDKQKVQAARDSITSAIAGLLFIIFSIVLLEIIGVHILQLPGFVK